MPSEIVNNLNIGVKLFKYVRETFKLEAPSQKQTHEAFSNHLVKVNGQTSHETYILQLGDEVLLDRCENDAIRWRDEIKHLEIAFEDDHIAIVWKEAGITTNTQKSKTLELSLPYSLCKSNQLDALKAPVCVEPLLDKASSGFVLCAKTLSALVWLKDQILLHLVKFTFTGIVHGNFGDTFDLAKGESIRLANTIEDSNCITTVQFLCAYESRNTASSWISLIRAVPSKLSSNSKIRKHQCRIHLQLNGHPVIGNSKYTQSFRSGRLKGLFFQLCKIELAHPITGNLLVFEQDIASKMTTLCERESRFYVRKQEENIQVLKDLQIDDNVKINENFAYQTGQQNFCGIEFNVSQCTMVPRRGTETLVDSILKRFPPNATFNVLDLGTGSGCIILSLLHHRPKAFGVGVDISTEALQLATQNAERHDIEHRVNFRVASFNNLSLLDGPFDVIVSNPPYLTFKDTKGFQSEIHEEPAIALYVSGTCGLEFYQEILSGLTTSSPCIFHSGTLLVLEVAHKMASRVKDLVLGFDAPTVKLEFVELVIDNKLLDRCLMFKIL